MKTFDEAMQAITVASHEEAQATYREIMGRYGSIMKEVGESQAARGFVMGAIRMFVEEQDMAEEDKALSIGMSLFINGIMIGIEMEKSE